MEHQFYRRRNPPARNVGVGTGQWSVDDPPGFSAFVQLRLCVKLISLVCYHKGRDHMPVFISHKREDTIQAAEVAA